jgi:hypothetical protein
MGAPISKRTGKWCRHIRMENIFGGVRGWTFVLEPKDTFSDVNAESWKFCPLCGTPKP